MSPFKLYFGIFRQSYSVWFLVEVILHIYFLIWNCHKCITMLQCIVITIFLNQDIIDM